MICRGPAPSPQRAGPVPQLLADQAAYRPVISKRLGQPAEDGEIVLLLAGGAPSRLPGNRRPLQRRAAARTGHRRRGTQKFYRCATLVAFHGAAPGEDGRRRILINAKDAQVFRTRFVSKIPQLWGFISGRGWGCP